MNKRNNILLENQTILKSKISFLAQAGAILTGINSTQRKFLRTNKRINKAIKAQHIETTSIDYQKIERQIKIP